MLIEYLLSIKIEPQASTSSKYMVFSSSEQVNIKIFERTEAGIKLTNVRVFANYNFDYNQLILL